MPYQFTLLIGLTSTDKNTHKSRNSFSTKNSARNSKNKNLDDKDDYLSMRQYHKYNEPLKKKK